MRTDPRGRTSILTHDDAGNLSEATDARGGVQSWSHDAEGRLTAATDARGKTTTLAYDPSGLRTRLTTSGGATTYNDDGRPAGLTEPRGSLPGADPADFLTAYSYDAAGNQVAITDPLGATTRLSHDRAGRLVAREDVGGARPPTPTSRAAFSRGQRPRRRHHRLHPRRARRLLSPTDTKGRVSTYTAVVEVVP